MVTNWTERCKACELFVFSFCGNLVSVFVNYGSNLNLNGDSIFKPENDSSEIQFAKKGAKNEYNFFLIS